MAESNAGGEARLEGRHFWHAVRWRDALHSVYGKPGRAHVFERASGTPEDETWGSRRRTSTTEGRRKARNVESRRRPIRKIPPRELEII